MKMKQLTIHELEKSLSGMPRLLKLSLRSFREEIKVLRKRGELRNDRRFRVVYTN